MSETECERALKEIERFLDGELDPPEAERLSAHLGGCPPCGDRAEFQRGLKAIVASKCCEEMPSTLRERISEILVHGDPPSRNR